MHRIAVLAAGLLAAIAATGCAVAVDPGVAPGGPPEAPQGSTSTYFIVTRPDVRRCAFPLCGGVFVARVNLVSTVCADGTRQADCHAAAIDLTELRLSEEQQAEFAGAFEQKRALVRGRLIQVDQGLAFPVNTLVVTEGWRGVTESVPSGRFSRLTDSGIRCVTHPCPSFLEQLLNSNVTQSIAEVDLAASDATPDEIELGFRELNENGILAAGSTKIVSGPAGTAAGFRASEFYVRVRPE